MVPHYRAAVMIKWNNIVIVSVSYSYYFVKESL